MLNNILRIILNKKTLEGSTYDNYMLLGILPARILYKKIAILFIINKCIKIRTNKLDFTHVRDYRAYDVSVKYTKKSFGKSVVDYIGPN